MRTSAEDPVMEPARDDLLTAAELANRLQVKSSTILEWHRAGRIPSRRLSHKILRFNLADVLAALDSRYAVAGREGGSAARHRPDQPHFPGWNPPPPPDPPGEPGPPCLACSGPTHRAGRWASPCARSMHEMPSNALATKAEMPMIDDVDGDETY